MFQPKLAKKERGKSRSRSFREIRRGNIVAAAAEFADSFKLWETYPSGTSGYNTSITDESNYLEAVAEALSRPEAFNSFRSNVAIRQTYDHVSYDLAKEYLSRIGMTSVRPLVKKIRDIALYGNARTFYFRSAGLSSPTVLRYLKIAKDLAHLFQLSKIAQIHEIGVGFGGQSMVVHRLYGLHNFVFMDLPEVNELAQRCCGSLCPDMTVATLDGRNPPQQQPELLISNYAFSELDRATQEIYFERVVKNSRSGYMILNQLSQKHLGGMTPRELQSRIDGSKLYPEIPESSPGNSLIVWGTERELPEYAATHGGGYWEPPSPV